jgi:predicted AAA+ superfamily ATPase
LQDQAAVALLGPRQVGKTTLAQAVAETLAKTGAGTTPALYLDLEEATDREKLADPALYLNAHEDKLVILDEIQNAPDLFATLRGLIDQGRRRGRKIGRFLLLGSASIVGPSWEGFVIENLINSAPSWTAAFYYRTSAGAEIDLILELPGGETWAIEVKRSLSPKVERGFHVA